MSDTLPPHVLHADFNEQTFNALHPINQSKVNCIYMIAEYHHDMGDTPLTPREFDDLYDMLLPDLERKAHALHDALAYLREQERI